MERGPSKPLIAYLELLLQNLYIDHVSSQAMYFSVIHSDTHNYNIFRLIKDVCCGIINMHIEPASEGKCKVQKL